MPLPQKRVQPSPLLISPVTAPVIVNSGAANTQTPSLTNYVIGYVNPILFIGKDSMIALEEAIGKGVEQLAIESKGEYKALEVFSQLQAGIVHLYVMIDTKEKRIEKHDWTSKFGELLGVESRTGWTNTVGYAIVREERDTSTCHFWQVYISPKYQHNESILVDGATFIKEKYYRYLSRMTFSSTREWGRSPLLKELGFTVLTTIYVKTFDVP